MRRVGLQDTAAYPRCERLSSAHKTQSKEETVTRFGGNEFTDFSVPLLFEGRYFVLEPGDPPTMTVFLERNQQPVFEVLKNQPNENAVTDVTANQTGVVTVVAKGTGKFLYKVRPASETSVAFGKLDGGEISARITDRAIQVGRITVENNRFIGSLAGVVVATDGSVGVGAPIPQPVRQWLSS